MDFKMVREHRLLLERVATLEEQIQACKKAISGLGILIEELQDTKADRRGPKPGTIRGQRRAADSV